MLEGAVRERPGKLSACRDHSSHRPEQERRRKARRVVRGVRTWWYVKKSHREKRKRTEG